MAGKRNKNGRWEEPIILYGRAMHIQLINSSSDRDQWQIVGNTPFKGEMVYLSKDFGDYANRWNFEAKAHLRDFAHKAQA